MIQWLLLSTYSYSQQILELSFSQPPVLTVNAGNDTTILQGTSAILGGDTVVQGGTPDYTFSWQPVENMNDPNISHPMVTPDSAITYVLYVTDENGCTATDEVNIQVNSLGNPETNRIINNNCKIIPNPNDGAFELSVKKFATERKIIVMISSYCGEIMLQESLWIPPGNDVTISYDIRSYPDGYYILWVKGKEINDSYTFIKN